MTIANRGPNAPESVSSGSLIHETLDDQILKHLDHQTHLSIPDILDSILNDWFEIE